MTDLLTIVDQVPKVVFHFLGIIKPFKRKDTENKRTTEKQCSNIWAKKNTKTSKYSFPLNIL